MMNRKRVCVSTILLGACLVGMPKAQAQSEQEPSVAEAARKAREQKKTPAKPSTVITNDTLKPATPATVQQATATTDSVPGTEATAASGAKTDAASTAQPVKGPTEEEIAKNLSLNGTPSYVLGDDVLVGAVGFDELNTKVGNIRKCGKSLCS